MQNDFGFIKLSRKVFSGELWALKRTFSDWEAWIDLIQSARFEPNVGIYNVGVASIELSRGQFVGSVRFLAQRWSWGERKVRVFLSYLRKNNMVTTETVSGHTVITLLNYAKYNDSSEDIPEDIPKDTARDTAKDTDNTQAIKELTESVTQLRTQLRTQQEIIENLGHSKDTKKKKDKNNKIFPNGNTKDGDPDGSPMFPHDGKNLLFAKLIEWMAEKTPYCYNPTNWSHGMTQKEFEALTGRYGFEPKLIAKTIADIENRKDLRKKYANLYLTTLNWLKRSKDER